MEWEKGIYELFEKLIAEVPEDFRMVVKPLLQETAEKKCLGRNGSNINEMDLISALFEVTPTAFESELIRICKSLDIDYKRYTELKEIQNIYKMSWEKVGKAFHPGNMHVSLYVTDKCNQNCLHCAANNKHYRPELPKEKWFEIIENVESSLRKQGRRGVYIWFGGEPTCREDIHELIKYCGDKGYYQSLITNGVLFDDAFAKYCADNGMSHVFVSIDSADPVKSDHLRGIENSLEYAKKAIQSATKYGLFTCCSTTIMKPNIDEIEDIKNLVESLKAQPYFRAIVKRKNAAVNWEDIGLTAEDYKRLYDFKYENAIEKIRCGKAGFLPAYEVFEMVPFMEQTCNDAELTAIEWGVGCQACRCFTGIDINGDIFPCGYPSKLLLGNALRDSYEDIMNSQLFKDIRDKKRIGKCALCHHIDLCGGGCRVHAECETGDFFESFSYCWHNNDHEHCNK